MATIKVRVSGRVQGVGFRQYALGIALTHSVDGEVWNTRQGTVELILQHSDRATLDELVQELWSGPGRVDQIEVEETLLQTSPGFRVGTTR